MNILQSKQHRRGGRDGGSGGTHGLDGAHLVRYQARAHPEPPHSECPRPAACGPYICDCLCLASFNVHYIPSSFHEPPSPPGHPPGCLDHAPQIASSASNRYIQSSIKHVILHNITHISQFTNIALYSCSQLRI